MRPTLYAVAVLLILLLAAGCGGQVTMLTATPLPTSTPDFSATEAHTAYIADQTAVANAQTDNAATASALEMAQAEFAATREASAALELTAQIALNTDREGLSIAQTEVARDTGVLQQSVEAIASEQAILSADRAALDDERAALDSERAALVTERAALERERTALEATRTAEAETRAALAVEATATAIAQAAQQRALASEQTTLAEAQNALATAQAALDSERGVLGSERATLEAERVALEAERAALDNERAALENERTILESERAALEGEMSAVATARAGTRPDSMPLVEATPTSTPVSDQADPSQNMWQQVDLPEFGITLMIPPGFEHRPLGSTEITYQRDDDPIWPSTIQIQQATLDDLFGGEAPADLDTGDPVTVLAAGLEDATEDDFMTILSPAESFPGPAFPAAQARVALTGTENPVAFVLLRTGDDSWLLMVITGSEADLAEWLDPIGHSIVPLGSAPAITAPTRVPLMTPTPVPAELPTELATDSPADTPETTLDEAIRAIGIAFAPPEGWTFEVLEASEFAYPNIELTDPAGEDYFIGMIRFTTEEFSTGVAEIPAGQSAVDTLTAMATTIPNDLGVEVTSPRVNEVTIGALTGAWTQLQDEAEVNRLYLFTLGEDEWLLVGAFGPREDFNAFSRGALRDFLNTLEPLAEQGVALGLDFVLPEGWEMSEPTGPTEAEPAVVNLKPAGGDDLGREIIIARGESARFTESANMPLTPADALTALEPIAAAIRDSGDFGTRLRVDPLQINMLTGATASLRGENNAARLYLFDLGDDDWLLIIAYARADGFNAFSRNELRVFLDSLSLAGGAEATARIEPIGPVEEAEVARVSDGDTIYVHLNGVEESVRIIGVDTPEAHSPTAGAEWLGYAATHFMNQYISPGDTVYLESDICDRDDFQRLLRYVWIRDEAGDWLMLEAELIRAGLAHVRTYDEDRYVPYFLALEREAQAARLGLWGDRPPAPPTDPLASRDATVWVANPDGPTAPLLYDAAALGNVPEPVAEWPNNMPATVRDIYYVYPTDIDPLTGEPVSAEKVGYWYWLEFNDFRGWVPEGWLLLEAPEDPAAPPETDIIAYAEPFVVSEDDLPVLSEPDGGEIVGTFAPESRVQARRLSYEHATGEWWMYIDTQTIDGWVPLANLSRLSPEYR